MKTIDFRLRPPYKEFKNEWYFGTGVLDNIAHQTSQTIAESARQRSMALLLQEMDEAGVDMGVVVGRFAFGAFQGMDEQIPGIPNATVSELASLYPERFVGMISVNPTNCGKAYEEIEQYVCQGNCSGVVIDAGYCEPAKSFDDSMLYPIYDYCQRKQVPISLGSGLIYDRLATSAPQAIDTVAVNFPDLRIVVGHGGWPYVTEACWIALKRDNVYLSPDYYMYGAPGWFDYVSAINYHMKDKMIFGTAYPFAALKPSVEHAKSCGIREDVYDKYMGGNAMAFLGIKD